MLNLPDNHEGGDAMIVRRQFDKGDVFYDITQVWFDGPTGWAESRNYVAFIRPGGAPGVKEECLTDKSKSLALCFDSWEEARAAADEHFGPSMDSNY